MDMMTIYLVCLLVGGFFVTLSVLGGADSDADADVDVDANFDFDADADADFDTDFDHDFDASADVDADAHAELGADHDLNSGPGFVDLLTVRALFLFAAFFGLTGVLLSLLHSGEPFTLVASLLTGLVVGLGGNYFIKRVGYAQVTSAVTGRDLNGLTAKVLVPFEGDRRGKISLVARGNRLQMLARSFDEDTEETFAPGDEVVVVRVDGSVAQVVKPD